MWKKILVRFHGDAKQALEYYCFASLNIQSSTKKSLISNTNYISAYDLFVGKKIKQQSSFHRKTRGLHQKFKIQLSLLKTVHKKRKTQGMIPLCKNDSA